ncbi:MAG: DNA translocase FtsK 4TM domain-containing protein, partial [Bacteroidetes bacterium]|nr:DNA translocase FtsK 4TM domain-containing protein [Bacteroidota bacterium]
MLKTKKKKNSYQKRIIAEKNPILTTNQKKNIFGILFILISLLVFLSIISYSKLDRANLSYQFSDILKILSSNSEVAYKLDSTRNLLGVLGAYISDFFLNSTLGVFSTIFPIMFFIFGISLFKKNENKNIFHTFNFLILFALIASSIFGVLRMHYSLLVGTSELSGAIGDYAGIVLSRLLGGVGSLLFLSASLLILILVNFDINIKKIFSVLKRKSKPVPIEEESIRDISIDQKTEVNLEKIKKLGKEKPAKNKLFGWKKEKTNETKIRIIRKDDELKHAIKNEILKDSSKKTDLQKTKELPTPISFEEKERQAELPNPWEEKINYKPLPLDILNPIPPENITVSEKELTRNAELLKEKLRLFDIEIEDISVTPGPVVTLFEIVPAPGVKISRIVGLEHDIALALAARGIRIIAPIPGKSAIGVEIPNAVASLVNARSVMGKIYESKAELPIAMGKMINGDVFITDLTKMPHILIAGSTGSGKSVGINMIIASLLFSKLPSEVKLIMIDPKKIELSFYNKLRKHYLAVSPDLDEEIITNPQNAVLMLKS